MLSQADNQMVTRVGPGTPMGNMMRQYWMPAIESSSSRQTDGRCACDCSVKTLSHIATPQGR